MNWGDHAPSYGSEIRYCPCGSSCCVPHSFSIAAAHAGDGRAEPLGGGPEAQQAQGAAGAGPSSTPHARAPHVSRSSLPTVAVGSALRPRPPGPPAALGTARHRGWEQRRGLALLWPPLRASRPSHRVYVCCSIST